MCGFHASIVCLVFIAIIFELYKVARGRGITPLALDFLTIENLLLSSSNHTALINYALLDFFDQVSVMSITVI